MNTLRVLLVEDDLGDIDLTREFLKDWQTPIELAVVNNGVDALKYLRREGPFSSAVRPDLIILDLNLPKKDGRELLREIKSDDQLKSIPSVILTTSDAEVDIAKSYWLGANCFITKPLSLDEFSKVIKAIEKFWFGVAQIPPRFSPPSR